MCDLIILIRFEFKKIWLRKSTYISLALLILITLGVGITGITGYSTIDGKKDTSHYDSMLTDRAYQKALVGRKIDKQLINETKEAYRKIDPDIRYTITKEYQIYARPYSSLRSIILQVYNPENTMEIQHLLHLSNNDINNFYSIRNTKLLEALRNTPLSEAEIKYHLKLNAKIHTPFTFEYREGYHTFLVSSFPITLFLTFATAICLAPIFAGEYITNTAQIILSTKYRNKEILSKIITSIIFSVLVSIFYLSISLLEHCIIYGFEGAQASIQLDNVLISYPLTYFSSCLILFICCLTVNLFVSGLTLLLSARLKSSFGVIVVICSILFAPLFLKVPSNIRLLYNLINLLPSNMININVIFGKFMYPFLGNPIIPYLFIPVFSIIVSFIVFVLAFQGFRKQQIS